MSQPEALTFTLTPVGEVVGVDISDLVYGISLETNEHGDGDCRVQMNDAYPHTDVLFRANSRLVVADDQGVVYMGRLEVPANEAQPGFGRITHTFRGYASAADDRIYSASVIFRENTAIEAIFEQTLAELCPDIQEGEINGGDRTLPEESQDFVLSSAQNIWNTIAPLGGDSIPLTWQVYAEDDGTDPKLWVAPRPTAAEYYTSMAAGNFFGGNPLPGGTRVTVTGDLRQVYNAVAVKIASGEHASGCACITVHDHNSQSNTITGVGVMRMAPLDLSSKVGLELSEATQAGQMLLSQLSTLRSSGTQITMDYPQTMLGSGGALPLWRVRAGRIVKVVDLESGDFLLGNELYIVSTRWEEPSRRLTLQLGQRNGISEAIGRSLRARRPGRSDVRQADPVPDIGREPRQAVKYDIVPHPGGTNRDVPYAPARHHHGTPNGDVAWTYGLDGVGQAITTPAMTAMGLIRGTILTWKIRCNPGGLIKYRLTIPEGWLILPGVEDPIHLPGGVVFAEGSNGSTGAINLEVLTNSEVDVEVQGVPTATWASLILVGTRNLIFSDPLTPLEAGTGLEGNEPTP